ncbi:MAG: hypothetical protein EAZ08_14320 [Cytophagales bacterium]|nr:MAG: hypothetical protein EAZ08_14320 [Cytophagales bacterium]
MDQNNNALLTYSSGKDCRDDESKSDEVVMAEIMAALKGMFGDDIPHPSKMLRTKWNSNPNSLGSFSYLGVGASKEDSETMA